MKYMVMECHLSYAVVLDENGRFLKVANMRYQVGQVVTDVVEMQVPPIEPKLEKTLNRRWVVSLAAMAACLMLVVTSVLYMGQVPRASVYMSINPEVRIDVNRKDVVVRVLGVNEDGKQLLEGYAYKKKALDCVMDELVDRAIDEGYLSAGGQITLTLDAKDNAWVDSKGSSLTSHLKEHLTDRFAVTIQVEDEKVGSHKVIIPKSTESSTPDSSYGDSDYGDYDDRESPDDDDEQDPVDSNYGDSDDSSSQPNHNGQSDYSAPSDVQDQADDDPSDDNQNEADDTAASNDGTTDYEAPDDDDRQPEDEQSSDDDSDDDEPSNDDEE